MRAEGAHSRVADPSPVSSDAEVELIELLFFAYRDFVGDADRLLESYKFGRAHHRALHFVNRRPGLTVADLLDILRITKQSLNRVLRELVTAGFIEQRAGAADRRQRLLYATPKGEELAHELIAVQGARLSQAIRAMGPGGEARARAFLEGVSRGAGP